MSQIVLLLRTLLILKSWRLLAILPTMALLFFGTQLCFLAARSLIEWRTERNISHVSGNKFGNIAAHMSADPSAIPHKLSAVTGIIDYLYKNEPVGMFGTYLSRVDCVSPMQAPVTNKISAQRRYHIDLSKSTSLCQTSYSSMLCCALFGAVASLGSSDANLTNDVFYNLHAFHFVPQPEKSTACKAEPDYFLMLPKILPYELSLVTVIASAYLLATTVSVINELKVKGFLRLMMRKGLSPFSYWASVWITTGVEMLLLSACMSASFYWHCPEVYSPIRIVHASLIVTAYLLCQAALVLLFTVLSNNFHTICKFVFMYVMISMGFTLADHFARSMGSTYGDFEALKKTVPLLPCVGVANQLLEAFTSQDRISLKGAGNLAMFILLVTVTVYLDYVLKSGNGLVYSRLLFCRIPENEPLPAASGRTPSVETPKLKVFARVSTTLNSNGGEISVDFYDNQIAVVFCEDSAKTGLLLNAVTGRVQVSSGLVWIDGYPASKLGATPHQRTRIGECPQEDALCYSLTVLHTLNLALVSSGNVWVDCEVEISNVVALLRLVDKLPCLVGSLSHGERRKLCIALALLGNPRLIVLIDPTRGLDPLSRRRFWRLLGDYRHERCIIVSTQFIDDVDIYADRQVFLSPNADSVLCAGSSQFVRGAATSGLVVKAILSPTVVGSTIIEKFWGNMPPGISASVRKSLLLVNLATSEAHLLESVMKALKDMGQDVGTLALYLPLLSDVYKRIKSLEAQGINELFTGSRKQQNPNASADTNGADEQRVTGGDAASADKLQEEPSQQRSNPSFAGSVSGILSLQCFALRRNYRDLILRAALSLILLAIHAYMLSFEKRSDIFTSDVWNNFSAQSNFSRGFCVSDTDIPKIHKITDAQCGLFYTGINAPDTNFPVLWKERAVPFYNFLTLPNQTRTLRDDCSELQPPELPCAIVYSNSWHPLMYNKARQVAAGSYSSPGSRQKQERAAAAAYFALRAVLNYFAHDRLPNKLDLSMFLEFNSYSISMHGVLSMCFITTIMSTIFLHDVIKRRAIKWRSYLATLGINPMAYWMSTLLLHWPQYAAAYCVAFVLGLAIHLPVFKNIYLAISALVTIIFGLTNNLLLAYLFSLFCPDGRKLLPAIHLLLSVVIGISPAFVQTKYLVCSVMIIALPPFATAILAVYCVKLHAYAMNSATPASVFTLIAQPQIRLCLIAIPAQTVLLVAALLIAEKVRVIFDARCSTSSTDRQPELENQDESDPLENDASTVELRGMTKSYLNVDVDAANNVTFNVKKGETLGIIGPNGSGTTTVTRAIIGQMLPSSGICQVRADGSAWLSGRQVASNRLITYAPQGNQLLFDSLTAAEHLHHYARILGASEDRVNQLVLDMNLGGDQDTPASQHSERIKRWLSISIALLSDSPLLVIDDASTGISSTGEVQLLWRKIKKEASKYTSTIISGHSLLGAESTHCQVVVLNSGVVAFQGSSHQLMDKRAFHMLDIEVKADTVDAAQQTKAAILKNIMGRFFSARILEQTSSRIQISFPTQRYGSQVDSLNWLLKLKEQYAILNLQFYTATADQILEVILKNHDAAIVDNSMPTPMGTFYEHCEP